MDLCHSFIYHYVFKKPGIYIGFPNAVRYSDNGTQYLNERYPPCTRGTYPAYKNREIIEQYPNDYPYPSCRVPGLSVNKQYLHVVIVSRLEILWIATAYSPIIKKI